MKLHHGRDRQTDIVVVVGMCHGRQQVHQGGGLDKVGDCTMVQTGAPCPWWTGAHCGGGGDAPW